MFVTRLAHELMCNLRKNCLATGNCTILYMQVFPKFLSYPSDYYNHHDYLHKTQAVKTVQFQS